GEPQRAVGNSLRVCLLFALRIRLPAKQRVEARARVRSFRRGRLIAGELAALLGGARFPRRGTLEQARELGPAPGLTRRARRRAREGRAVEIEVLAEVAARLVLHRVRHRLRALVVVARIPVPAVAAAAQVVATRLALAVARDRLADRDRRAAEVALERGHR